MSHYHYHEIEAANPAECGHELGKLFGPIIRDYIEHGRACKSWRDRKARAKVLLSLTARHFPSYIGELSAYAAGAGVELLDLWTISIEDELEHRAEEKCTTVVTNSGRLIAHNEDWSPDAVEDICILKKRTGTTTTLEALLLRLSFGRNSLEHLFERICSGRQQPQPVPLAYRRSQSDTCPSFSEINMCTPRVLLFSRSRAHQVSLTISWRAAAN